MHVHVIHTHTPVEGPMASSFRHECNTYPCYDLHVCACVNACTCHTTHLTNIPYFPGVHWIQIDLETAAVPSQLLIDFETARSDEYVVQGRLTLTVNIFICACVYVCMAGLL
jgi:hypothetical protein